MKSARDDHAHSALLEAYRLKAEDEVRTAEGLISACSPARSAGSLEAQVVVVKGESGPAEIAGGEAFSGPDGTAVRSGLKRLGWDEGRVYAMMAPVCDDVSPGLGAQRIRRVVEAIDPELVLATDVVARDGLVAAFDLERLPFGRTVDSHGRWFTAIDGLEASLDDIARKRKVWDQFKAARRKRAY